MSDYTRKAMAEARHRMCDYRLATIATPNDGASAELIEAAENVVIAFGMGWDMEGVIERLIETLPQDSVCRARAADRSKQ